MTILHDLNWEVRQGEHWVIFGANGSGKSSLVNSLLGYLWPTDGHIDVLGETIGHSDMNVLRRRVALITEHLVRHFNLRLTGLETLVTGLRGHWNIWSPITDKEYRLACELAAQLHLENYLDKETGILSSGERQRLFIARALLSRPEIMILDEPCAAMDLSGRESILKMMDSIGELKTQGGSSPTLIMITHHVEEIATVFNKMLLLNNGTVFAAGAIDDVLTDDNLRKLFSMDFRIERYGGRWTARVK